MEETKFLEILNEIRIHYLLAVAEKTSIGNTEYKRLFSRVKAKLLHTFPSLKQHSDTLEYFVTTIVGFLDKPIAMLKYIRNKAERDYFMGKVASKQSRLLLDNSKTRITNIRQIIQLIDLLEIEVTETIPGYFYEFREKVAKILDEQTDLAQNGVYQNDTDLEKSDKKRIENAHILHEIVYKFCMSIATN